MLSWNLFLICVIKGENTGNNKSKDLQETNTWYKDVDSFTTLTESYGDGNTGYGVSFDPSKLNYTLLYYIKPQVDLLKETFWKETKSALLPSVTGKPKRIQKAYWYRPKSKHIETQSISTFRPIINYISSQIQNLTMVKNVDLKKLISLLEESDNDFKLLTTKETKDHNAFSLLPTFYLGHGDHIKKGLVNFSLFLTCIELYESESKVFNYHGNPVYEQRVSQSIQSKNMDEKVSPNSAGSQRNSNNLNHSESDTSTNHAKSEVLRDTNNTRRALFSTSNSLKNPHYMSQDLNPHTSRKLETVSTDDNIKESYNNPSQTSHTEFTNSPYGVVYKINNIITNKEGKSEVEDDLIDNSNTVKRYSKILSRRLDQENLSQPYKKDLDVSISPQCFSNTANLAMNANLDRECQDIDESIVNKIIGRAKFRATGCTKECNSKFSPGAQCELWYSNVLLKIKYPMEHEIEKLDLCEEPCAVCKSVNFNPTHTFEQQMISWARLIQCHPEYEQLINNSIETSSYDNLFRFSYELFHGKAPEMSIYGSTTDLPKYPLFNNILTILLNNMTEIQGPLPCVTGCYSDNEICPSYTWQILDMAN